MPNITGTFGTWPTPWEISGGAFYLTNLSGQFISSGAGGGGNVHGNFDASKSNPIYGNSDHVTTANFTIRIWKRIS